MADSIAVACSKWPRLYLDTAEILYVADGKTPRAILDELVETMRARGVWLVVSIEHLQDALPRATTLMRHSPACAAPCRLLCLFSGVRG